MRHYNPTSTSCMHYGAKVTKPYQHSYIDAYRKNEFAKANSKKTYVKVLQYVADRNDKGIACWRVDINRDVLGWNIFAKHRDLQTVAYASRGQHSNMYAQLIYLDLLDYDKNYRYFITDKGRKVLKTAYINDTLKLFFKA